MTTQSLALMSHASETLTADLTEKEQQRLLNTPWERCQLYRLLKQQMEPETFISGDAFDLSHSWLAAELQRTCPQHPLLKTVTPEKVRYGIQQLERQGLIRRLSAPRRHHLRFQHLLASTTAQPAKTAKLTKRIPMAASSSSTPVSFPPEDAPRDPVECLFDYWREVHQHPHARLDDKRYRLLANALAHGYTLTDCQQAIRGCRHSPFHQGDNPRGQRYDSLSLIFRDAEHIERFMAMEAHPPAERQAAYREAHASGLDWLADAFEAHYGDRLPTGNPFLWKRQKA